MKKISGLLIFMLLLIALPAAVRAQSAAAKAPPRRPGSRTTQPSRVRATPRPKTTATSAPQTTAPPVVAAPNRANSAALPKPVPVAQPTPPPARKSPPPPPPARRGRIPSRSVSGGLAYEKGDKLLNVGVGLSSYYYGNPIGASFEIGVDKDISVGAQFDYNAGNYDGYGSYYNARWGYTATYFGARGSYHLNRVLGLNTRKVDLYAGLGLGYRSFRWNDSRYGSGYDYRSGLFFNYFVGGKYYFTNKVGAFLELGYTGLSSSRVGLAVKF